MVFCLLGEKSDNNSLIHIEKRSNVKENPPSGTRYYGKLRGISESFFLFDPFFCHSMGIHAWCLREISIDKSYLLGVNSIGC